MSRAQRMRAGTSVVLFVCAIALGSGRASGSEIAPPPGTAYQAGLGGGTPMGAKGTDVAMDELVLACEALDPP